MSHTPTDARSWLALRYVLGELSVQETADFEAGLTDDVELCQAVADATRLVAGVRQAGDSLRVPSVGRAAAATTTPRRGVGALLAVALSACLAAALLSRSREPAVAVDGSARQLVSMWRGASEWSESAPRLGDAEADADDDDVARSDDHVPGWLFAAVSMEKRRDADSDEL